MDKINTILDDVFTLKEAGELWNVNPNALLQNCLGRVKAGFQPHEIKKSASTWLVTRDGMTRLYGEPKTEK